MYINLYMTYLLKRSDFLKQASVNNSSSALVPIALMSVSVCPHSLEVNTGRDNKHLTESPFKKAHFTHHDQSGFLPP